MTTQDMQAMLHQTTRRRPLRARLHLKMPRTLKLTLTTHTQCLVRLPCAQASHRAQLCQGFANALPILRQSFANAAPRFLARLRQSLCHCCAKPGLCQAFAKPLPNLNQAFAKPLPSVCQAFAKSLSRLCQAFAESLPSVRQAFAKRLPSLCQPFAKPLPSVCQAFRHTAIAMRTVTSPRSEAGAAMAPQRSKGCL